MSSAPVSVSDAFESSAVALSLNPGRALSLRPREAGRLRICQGRAWVTLGVPGGLSPSTSGDSFLAAGESLWVPAGSRLVMESLPTAGADGAVRFDWVQCGRERAVRRGAGLRAATAA